MTHQIYIERNFEWYHVFCRVDAMAAPMADKGVELERTLGFFQFNRDCGDEEVSEGLSDLSYMKYNLRRVYCYDH